MLTVTFSTLKHLHYIAPCCQGKLSIPKVTFSKPFLIHFNTVVHLGARLLKELKKLDDKALLVEVQLNESKTYHALNNVPKSRYFIQIENFIIFPPL